LHLYNIFMIQSLGSFLAFISFATWCVATPFWGKCEDEICTPKSGNLESSRTLETLKLDCRGQTPRLEVFFIPLERSWSVDVENDLTPSCTIWRALYYIVRVHKKTTALRWNFRLYVFIIIHIFVYKAV